MRKEIIGDAVLYHGVIFCGDVWRVRRGSLLQDSLPDYPFYRHFCDALFHRGSTFYRCVFPLLRGALSSCAGRRVLSMLKLYNRLRHVISRLGNVDAGSPLTFALRHADSHNCEPSRVLRIERVYFSQGRISTDRAKGDLGVYLSSFLHTLGLLAFQSPAQLSQERCVFDYSLRCM